MVGEGARERVERRELHGLERANEGDEEATSGGLAGVLPEVTQELLHGPGFGGLQLLRIPSGTQRSVELM
jgi:hypothetical protein